MYENLTEKDLPNFETANPISHPNWFHRNGSKMHFNPRGSSDYRTLIASYAAEVVIQRVEAPQVLFEARWEIRQIGGKDPVNGEVLMIGEYLAQAFGLVDLQGGSIPGVFIRQRCALNISGPGNSHDGNPNVSIDLDRPIQLGILRMLQAR